MNGVTLLFAFAKAQRMVVRKRLDTISIYPNLLLQ